MKRVIGWLKKPWFWVSLGAIMTAASALLSHNVIMDNNRKIEVYKLQSQAITQKIDDQWEGIRRLEQDGNIALLMSMITEASPQLPESIHSGVKQYMVQLVEREGDGRDVETIKQSPSGTIFPELIGFINQTRSETIDIIDKDYLEKLTLQEHIQQLEQENDSYSIIALFLQIMGLILVLSKDLARKTWPS